MVSRWGGDEFVCLLLEVKQETEVTRCAEQLIARFAEPFEFNGTVFFHNQQYRYCHIPRR